MARGVTRDPAGFGWFALRSGMMDVLGFSRYVKP
jgi:hypothetical protein